MVKISDRTFLEREHMQSLLSRAILTTIQFVATVAKATICEPKFKTVQPLQPSARSYNFVARSFSSSHPFSDSTMKFDTRKEKPLHPKTPDGCYEHANKIVPEDHQDTKDLGRQLRFEADIIVTPILSSARTEGRRQLLTGKGVDELSQALSNLMLSDSESTDENAYSPKKEASVSTRKLIAETPESSDASLGRFKKEFVSPKTKSLVEVKRSLRLCRDA